jgi:hypothetical protein
VLRALADAADDGAFWSGLLADEFMFTGTAGTRGPEMLDRRESVRYEQLGDNGGYDLWQELRRAASVALPKLQAYAPVPAHAGEVFALRGFASLRVAEDFCPGFPLNDVVNYKPVFTAPLSTEEALAKALSDFDSAVVYAADSARVLNLAQVGRARTLLGLGRFDEAATAVAEVPTDYVANTEYLASVGLENRLSFAPWDMSQSVADREGATGVAFVSAGDPRVQVTPLGTGADGITPIYAAAKYPTSESPLALASGIEARLIEAEASLHRGDPNWLTILNTLRTTQVSPALADTTDPGSADAQVDLLFRERAFWLFGTGHRLADLRRLVRVYGRPAESVFPTGAYSLGGVYATGTSIPFPARLETQFNPAVTGCISR